MPGFSKQYAKIDRRMALLERTDRPVPMWMLLLFIADVTSMRWYRAPDIEEAREALFWSHWLWNLARLPDGQRESEWERRAAEIERFVGSLPDLLQMVVRSQSWMEDTRVVTRASIEVEPSGRWRLDVVTT